MYLHLGQSTVVRYDEIIGIFDLDATTVMKSTRDYLTKAQKNDEVINVSYELPKSFVLCKSKDDKKQRVYISQISSATLLKRAKNNEIPD